MRRCCSSKQGGHVGLAVAALANGQASEGALGEERATDGSGSAPISFPGRLLPAKKDRTEDALAYTPVFVGIA